MNTKKGKALADQLVEDLLGDEESANAKVKAKSKLKAKKHSKTSKAKSARDVQALDDESDVFLDSGDVSNAQQMSDDESRTLAIAEIDADDLSATAKSGFASGERTANEHSKGTLPPDWSSAGANLNKSRSSPSGKKGGVTEAFLSQSESLKIAQNKILELENEIERLRVENEELGAAAETLRRRTDESTAHLEKLSARHDRSKEDFEEEREALMASLEMKGRDSDELKLKVEELEMRLSTNIQKIRVRERELENRLELIKLEGSSMLRGKDELILDLKRQLDQLNHELENYRFKGQEMNQQLGERDDVLRRTVKALRIALSMLEGSEDVSPLKKVK